MWFGRLSSLRADTEGLSHRKKDRMFFVRLSILYKTIRHGKNSLRHETHFSIAFDIFNMLFSSE